MHFSAFVVFQIVLVVGIHSVQANEDEAKMRMVMCDPDYEEVRNEILGCIEGDFSEYNGIVEPCAEGLQSTEPQALVEYWCSKSSDEVKKIQMCVDENVKASGKEEEMKEKGKPIKACLDEKFGSQERRK